MWWAAVNENLTRAQQARGATPFLCSPTPEELCERLDEEDRKVGR